MPTNTGPAASAPGSTCHAWKKDFFMQQPSSLQLFGRLILVTLLVLAAIWILRRFLPALAWAGVVALATWPARESLVGKGMRPSVAGMLLALVVGILIIGPLILLAIEMAREGSVIVETVRQLREAGLGTPQWVPQIPFIGIYVASWWQDHLADADAAKELLGRAESLDLLHWTRSLGGEAISRLMTLAFTLLALFFAYRDGPTIAKQSQIVADRLVGPSAERLGEEAIVAIRATVNGLVLVGLAEGAVLGVAYVIAGVIHPVLFGFATALLATVPFGAPLVVVIACFALLVQSRITAAILLFLFASLVVFVADHFVRPGLIGASTRLPFLWILLGIFGGLETFGLIGLFVGPAIMAAVLAIWRESANPDRATGR
jgi:predicted PurR-regulated permease PerM